MVDAARSISRSYAARLDRRKRKWKMEGSFADAANNHGFKRSRWRGLWRQTIQDYMIALCQNLRILVGNRLPDRAGAVIQTAKQAFAAFFKQVMCEIGLIVAPLTFSRPIIGI